MKAKFALTIKSGALTQERAYELASQAVGRALVPGFGLSTCTHGELIAILDAISGKRSAGRQFGSSGDSRTAERPNRRTPLPRRADGEARASLGQYGLLQQLREQLHLSPEEFAGIATRATGKAHSSASKDIQKIIEALKAIARRRRAAGIRDQGLGVGEEPERGCVR